MSELKTVIYDEVSDFAQSTMRGKDYFTFIYGSYATSHFRPDSDLDIMFAANTCPQDDFDAIKDFVVGLHRRHGLTIDEEVPYENKLLVPYQSIAEAATLNAFRQEGHDGYVVPSIPNDIAVLGSPAVRSRLVLNALTTPHVFVAGNEQKYDDLRGTCEQALVQLAYGLTDVAAPGVDDLQRALFEGPDGETGQAHLGYKIERAEVVDHLQGLIHRTLELQND